MWLWLTVCLLSALTLANSKTFLIETAKNVEGEHGLKDMFDQQRDISKKIANPLFKKVPSVKGSDYKDEDVKRSKNSFTLRVLLMNIWGLKRMAKERKTRIPEIANFLKKSKHDIVFIQEAWYYSDYKQLRDTFPYSTFFGSPGSFFCPPTNNSQSFLNRIAEPLGCNGLTILSKHKILEIDHVFFTDRMAKIEEKAVKRGAFAATMKVQKNVWGVLKTIKVSAINTHLTSWHDAPEEKWSSLREKQADDVIRMVASHKTKSDIVIVAGDLNSRPGSPVYNKFISAGLKDSLIDLEGDKSRDAKYATYGHPDNTWSGTDDPMRIDFIMYSFNNSKVAARTSAYKTIIAETKKKKSMSDHQWVEAFINIDMKK